MEGIKFKVALKDITPEIWREFQVPADMSLEELHEVLQVVMGWENVHLYEFQIGDRRYGSMEEETPKEVQDADETYLDDLNLEKGSTINYLYDFGDGWEHTVTVLELLDEEPETAVCLNGGRECPPEDCGGRWGYSGLLEVIADPKHPQHKEMKEWLGGEFDPEFFDKDEINEELKEVV